MAALFAFGIRHPEGSGVRGFKNKRLSITCLQDSRLVAKESLFLFYDCIPHPSSPPSKRSIHLVMIQTIRTLFCMSRAVVEEKDKVKGWMHHLRNIDCILKLDHHVLIIGPMTFLLGSLRTQIKGEKVTWSL